MRKGWPKAQIFTARPLDRRGRIGPGGSCNNPVPFFLVFLVRVARRLPLTGSSTALPHRNKVLGWNGFPAMSRNRQGPYCGRLAIGSRWRA